MTDNLLSAPIQHSQSELVRSAEVLPPLRDSDRQRQPWSNEHTAGTSVDFAGSNPTTGYASYEPQPAQFIGNTVYHDPLPLGPGLVEPYAYRGHQNFTVGPPPVAAQHVPLALGGPPRLELQAPLGPEMPNDGPFSRGPCLPNVAGPSQRGPGPIHSGMSATEDLNLKRLASHYLHSHGSYINKFRTRRSRSGGYKVLIVLEIDDTI
ncbi:hypothetical protein BJV74DRAFT_871963 [Russula compacta]|nr:hypothetical protein BJV74DRAFT_871963 [Russula compacta]